MAEKKKPAETPVEAEIKQPEKVDVAKFKARKLKAINEMEDKAKAKVLAERVLSN